MKQVPDPDQADRIRVKSDGRGIDDAGLERRANPFDEYALECALRLTEDGRSPRQRMGDVTIVTFGPADAAPMLRAGLATGADRALRVDASDGLLDGRLLAHGLAKLVRTRGYDLVLLGKQSVDGDGNEVAQRLAAILDWPQATCTTAVTEAPDHSLMVQREVDGGIHLVRMVLPAVIGVDLRIVAKDSVRSVFTPADFEYPGGVRFASLPAIMQAKRKPLETISLVSLVGTLQPLLKHTGYSVPPRRPTGQVVTTTAELVNLLANNTKLL